MEETLNVADEEDNYFIMHVRLCFGIDVTAQAFLQFAVRSFGNPLG